MTKLVCCGCLEHVIEGRAVGGARTVVHDDFDWFDSTGPGENLEVTTVTQITFLNKNYDHSFRSCASEPVLKEVDFSGRTRDYEHVPISTPGHGLGKVKSVVQVGTSTSRKGSQIFLKIRVR